MASDQPSRPIDPLLMGVSDGVSTGYQALELVLAGLRESLRLQAGQAPLRASGVSVRPPAAGSPAASAVQRDRGANWRAPRTGTAGSVLGDVSAIAGELLVRVGAVAEELAHALQQPAPPGAAAQTPELELAVSAGEAAGTEFTIWNTGPVALRPVRLVATQLIGAGVRSPLGAVEFTPEVVDGIGPGKAETVTVHVSAPADTPAGEYRALLQAHPGDAWAMLRLTVTARAAPSQP